jgi:hypothetical protein
LELEIFGGSQERKGIARWSYPPSRVTKLNVDAAVLKNSTKLAVVARDD